MAKKLAIGNRVRELRERNEMTQVELGRHLGLTRQTVAAIEQCRYSPSLETAFQISRLFGFSVEQVFYWNDSTHQSFEN